MSCTSTGLPLLTLVVGLTIQACGVALIESVPELIRILASRKEPAFVVSSTVLFNAFMMMNMLGYIPNYFADSSSCTSINTFEIITYHLSMLVFDAFILTKSYATTRMNKVFLWISIAAVAYRLAWSIADVILTHVSWSDEYGYCQFQQNLVTGFHYLLADILCDVIATAGSVTMLVRGNYGWDNLMGMLVRENVFRSVLTLATNIAAMYLGQANTSYDVISMVWLIQDYILVVLLNMERVYRSDRMSTVSTNSKIRQTIAESKARMSEHGLETHAIMSGHAGTLKDVGSKYYFGEDRPPLLPISDVRSSMSKVAS